MNILRVGFKGRTYSEEIPFGSSHDQCLHGAYDAYPYGPEVFGESEKVDSIPEMLALRRMVTNLRAEMNAYKNRVNEHIDYSKKQDNL